MKLSIRPLNTLDDELNNSILHGTFNSLLTVKPVISVELLDYKELTKNKDIHCEKLCF